MKLPWQTTWTCIVRFLLRSCCFVTVSDIVHLYVVCVCYVRPATDSDILYRSDQQLVLDDRVPVMGPKSLSLLWCCPVETLNQFLNGLAVGNERDRTATGVRNHLSVVNSQMLIDRGQQIVGVKLPSLRSFAFSSS